jgi:hypothetical protein
MHTFQDDLDEQGRQRERASAWIAENWQGDTACAVCRNNNWQIGDVFELRRYHGGTLVLGGDPIFPVFPVTCNVCGNTIFINAVRSGVLTVDNLDVSAEATPSAGEVVAETIVSEGHTEHSVAEEVEKPEAEE